MRAGFVRKWCAFAKLTWSSTLHTSHCTLRAHSTLNTDTSHSTSHLTSSHLIWALLTSPQLFSCRHISSHICHLSSFLNYARKRLRRVFPKTAAKFNFSVHLHNISYILYIVTSPYITYIIFIYITYIIYVSYISNRAAICKQRFQKTLYKTAHKRITARCRYREPITPRNERGRTRLTHELPFIPGCSHFARKKTMFLSFALRHPPQHKSQATFMQPWQCVVHHFPKSPLLKKNIISLKSHHFSVSSLFFVTTSISHHFPISHHTTSLSHHFPKSPLP